MFLAIACYGQEKTPAFLRSGKKGGIQVDWLLGSYIGDNDGDNNVDCRGFEIDGDLLIKRFPLFGPLAQSVVLSTYTHAHTSSGGLRELRVLVLTARTLKLYRVFGESPATSHPFARPLNDATLVFAAETGVATGGTEDAPPVEETPPPPLPPPPPPLLMVPRVVPVPVAAAISSRLPATPSSRKSTNLQ